MPSEHAIFRTPFGGSEACPEPSKVRSSSTEPVVPISAALPKKQTTITKPLRNQANDNRVELAVGKYLGQVWRVLCRSGLRPADADDAAQDVFWVFAKRLDDIPPAAERSFVLATALRIASDYRRSAWNRSVTETLDPELCDDYQLSPESHSEQRELLTLLDRALDGLTNDERAVFVLMELEQLTREKTAEILQLPPGTVASRYKRAKDTFTEMAQRLQRRTRRLP